jgi:hypothetical protein
LDGITDVFLQIPRSGPAALREMIRRLHAIGVRVDALDGDPHYALEGRHAAVLQTVLAVIEYNRAAREGERFDGIRYDNEPYLLGTFGGVKRDSVLRQYLSLLDKIHAVTSRADLTFGVDIPFWFDSRNRFNEPIAAVDGKVLSEWVIEKSDNIAIMDYRTVAFGPDGVVAHGFDELSYAAELNKEVLIGLETVYLPDETVMAFGPDGSSDRVVLSGFDGQSLKVSLIPAGTTHKELAHHIKTLGEIFRATAPADKISFDTLTPEDLKRVMTQTKRELSPLKSFVGFAVHSYESYRPWMEGAD